MSLHGGSRRVIAQCAQRNTFFIASTLTRACSRAQIALVPARLRATITRARKYLRPVINYGAYRAIRLQHPRRPKRRDDRVYHPGLPRLPRCISSVALRARKKYFTAEKEGNFIYLKRQKFHTTRSFSYEKFSVFRIVLLYRQLDHVSLSQSDKNISVGSLTVC